MKKEIASQATRVLVNELSGEMALGVGRGIGWQPRVPALVDTHMRLHHQQEVTSSSCTRAIRENPSLSAVHARPPISLHPFRNPSQYPGTIFGRTDLPNA